MATNRFKKNLDKDKAKEIVGNTAQESVQDAEEAVKEEVNNSVTDTTSVTAAETEDTTATDTTATHKSTKKTTPSKKLREEAPKKPGYTKLGVNIKEGVKDKVDALAADNEMKPNEVIVDLLNRVFNGKDFTVEIEKKDKTKVTSFNIPEPMDKALTKLNKKTGVPKSEIFNKLVEEALKEFFQ